MTPTRPTILRRPLLAEGGGRGLLSADLATGITMNHAAIKVGGTARMAKPSGEPRP